MSAKPIVTATDGSPESLHAVEWAAKEAALRGAPLRIVSAAALPPRMIERKGGSNLETVAEHIRKDRDRALAVAAKRAAETSPGLLTETDDLEGPPARAVADSGSGALMLVVGSRGIGAFAAMVLGSVSRYVASHATCPVVVMREETAAAHQQIGVGIGDLDTCAESLTFAFEEAALRNASLVVVHAWHFPQSDISRAGSTAPALSADTVEAEAAEQLAGLLAPWRKKYPGVAVTEDVVYGHPGRALVGLSARADLVVLGRHTGRHSLGSVRHAVLQHAHGPVAVVPPA
jgi:nucleotide-binding universal stress UspA family protein